jgi:hypothetical protein
MLPVKLNKVVTKNTILGEKVGEFIRIGSVKPAI